jgi:hypothetical protein
MAEVIGDLQALFAGPPPSEPNERMFRALAERWGFAPTRNCKRLAIVARENEIDAGALVTAEMSLVRRLGWPVKDTPAERAK